MKSHAKDGIHNAPPYKAEARRRDDAQGIKTGKKIKSKIN
ncbi:MAG: hypothetical protein RL115_287 [Bacteroidota bacterium]|jgi:hypothetical protein